MVNSTNKPGITANKNKYDEFYTRLSDIDNEIKHYRKHFRGKTVLCNCDDPRKSNFFHYFSHNFEKLKLKKLITVCYKNQQRDLFSQNDSEKAIYLEYEGDKNNNKVPDPDEIGIFHLESDGDFRSKECIEILKQSDIVCTNPPFSLLREYVQQLMEYKKKFLIIGSWNVVAYNEIFKFIKNNQMWIGINSQRSFSGFIVPPNYSSPGEEAHFDEDGNKIIFTGHNCWFTNMDNKKRHEEFMGYQKYTKEKYPKYDTYNAIECGYVKDIPVDYKGEIGVPPSFMDKYNPKQFDIMGKMSTTKIDEYNLGYPLINGKKKYARIIIKWKGGDKKLR